MRSRKFFFALIPLILILILSSCTDEDTTEPTTYHPGCDVQNLIGHIKQANAALTTPAIIELDPDCVYTLTEVEHTQNFNGLDIHSGLPGITSEIAIMGNDAIIDIQPASGEDYFGHLFVYAQGELDLYDLTLQNGRRIHGGAIFNYEGSVFASNVVFQNNQAFGAGADFPGLGGAIYNQSGLLRTIEGSLFVENMASNSTTPYGNKGGAIYSINSGLTIYNTMFALNWSGDEGGAVYIERVGVGEEVEGSLFDDVIFDGNTARYGAALSALNENSVFIISKSQFLENEASENAGALDIQTSTLSVTFGEFRLNTAADTTGAFFISNSEVDIDNTRFIGNTALSCGAVSITSNSIVEISDSEFTSNRADSYHGGAICHIEGELLVEDSEFTTNQALTFGGAMYITDPFEINRSIFYNNMAHDAGAMHIGFTEFDNGNVPTQMDFDGRVVDSTFTNNQATNNGGAIWFHGAQNLLILRSTIDNNTAHDGYGGGIYRMQGDLFVTNSTISGNNAQRGGGIFDFGRLNIHWPILMVTNSTIVYNTAWEEDGGGGMSMWNEVTIKNSIIANNTNFDCDLNQGMHYTRAGENIDLDGSCGITTADPLLGVLSDNGGYTYTHPLGAASPAIDFASDCPGPTEDQRGVARPHGNACDVGSFEFQGVPAPPPPPPAPADPTATSAPPTATNTLVPPTNTPEVIVCSDYSDETSCNEHSAVCNWYQPLVGGPPYCRDN